MVVTNVQRITNLLSMAQRARRIASGAFAVEQAMKKKQTIEIQTEIKEKGIVKIDIDLVIWNEEVLKPADVSRKYIVDLLPSLKK